MLRPLRQLAHNSLGLLGRGTAALGVGSAAPRVLGYHGVDDPERLGEQLSWVGDRFRFVDLSEFHQILAGEAAPEKAVLVTFDDARPSVVEQGLPVLKRLGVPAVMFVCPGMVDTDEPYWWDVVVEAAGTEVVGSLKVMPDEQRRRQVDEMRAGLDEGGRFMREQMTSAMLESWVAGGNDVGNHTWDHPMLDTCSDDDQVWQIEKAHGWLDERGLSTTSFAFPNGNSTETARRVLSEFGYESAFLFDHKLVDSGDRLAVSRLRVNSDDSLGLFVAKVSGVHPAIHERLRG